MAFNKAVQGAGLAIEYARRRICHFLESSRYPPRLGDSYVAGPPVHGCDFPTFPHPQSIRLEVGLWLWSAVLIWLVASRHTIYYRRDGRVLSGGRQDGCCIFSPSTGKRHKKVYEFWKLKQGCPRRRLHYKRRVSSDGLVLRHSSNRQTQEYKHHSDSVSKRSIQSALCLRILSQILLQRTFENADGAP